MYLGVDFLGQKRKLLYPFNFFFNLNHDCSFGYFKTSFRNASANFLSARLYYIYLFLSVLRFPVKRLSCLFLVKSFNYNTGLEMILRGQMKRLGQGLKCVSWLSSEQ